MDGMESVSLRVMKKEVVVVVGPGSIGQAIARRVSAGKRVLLADLRADNAKAAGDVMTNAGFDVSATTVDVSSRESIQTLVREATKLGDVTGLVHAAGVSPSQAGWACRHARRGRERGRAADGPRRRVHHW
jgi:NAD(P)-dependent dehydrogenase (short-subunit alcohol dehydrogenase family)